MNQQKKEYSSPEIVSYGSVTALTAATESGSQFDSNFNLQDPIPDADNDGEPEIAEIGC